MKLVSVFLLALVAASTKADLETVTTGPAGDSSSHSPEGSPSYSPAGSPSYSPAGSPSYTPNSPPTAPPTKTDAPSDKPSASPSAAPSQVPSAAPSAKCPGNCTFTEKVTYTKNAAGKIIKLVYKPSHSATGDCESDIYTGAGRFRFKRTTDAAIQEVTRDLVQTAYNNHGHTGGWVSGSPLPPDVRVRIFPIPNPTDIGDIEVGPNGGTFEKIDLYFAHITRCDCKVDGTRNESEIVVYLHIDATGVTHNGGTRTENGNEVTYTWQKIETCDEAQDHHPTHDDLETNPDKPYELEEAPIRLRHLGLISV